MTDAPIPLVLDLWSLGHSAGDIAARTGVSRKSVTLIVHQARRIGDPRATVLHCYEEGRLAGRPGRDGTKIRRGAKTVKGKAVVMLVPKQKKPKKPRQVWGKATCVRGHERVPANLGAQGHCLQCRREKRWAKEAAQ